MAETWSIDDDGNPIPGTGRRLIKAKRCESTDAMATQRCIGVDGHDGFHWRYDHLGRYCWWKGGDAHDPMEIVSGSVPDGHSDYVKPRDRYADTYTARSQWIPIEDSEIPD